VLEGIARSVYAALDWTRQRPFRTFLLLAFAFSWVDWLSLVVSGAHIVPGRLPTDLAGMAGPALAAMAAAAASGGEAGLKAFALRLARFPWRSPWPWLLGPTPAYALAFVLLARYAVGAPVPDLADFLRYPGLPEIAPVFTFDLVLAGAGIGQEVGWRGFALPRLQDRFGPLGGALAVSIPWAVWLLPLLLLHFTATGTPSDVGATLALAGVLIVSSSLLLAHVVARTEGGIAAAATWHACLRFATATPGARDGVAAQVTLVLAAAAAVLVVAELRARRQGRTLLVPDTSRKY
jgi:uncharacterized protein